MVDLVLTDMTGIRIQVDLQAANHRIILSEQPLSEITAIIVKTQRFNIKRANWDGLKLITHLFTLADSVASALR